jgi:hypothetical protein
MGKEFNFLEWDNYLKLSVLQVFNELKNNSKCMLCESDLKCKLYHYLTNITDQIPNIGIYTEMTHLENNLSKKYYFRDMSILKPNLMKENHEIFNTDNDKFYSKGYKHRGPIIHIELKFTRQRKAPSEPADLDLDDIEKLKNFNSNPYRKRKFVIIHCTKDVESLSRGEINKATNIKDKIINKISGIHFNHLKGCLDIYVFDKKDLYHASFLGTPMVFNKIN